jgi:hypothetical protein
VHEWRSRRCGARLSQDQPLRSRSSSKCSGILIERERVWSTSRQAADRGGGWGFGGRAEAAAFLALTPRRRRRRFGAHARAAAGWGCGGRRVWVRRPPGLGAAAAGWRAAQAGAAATIPSRMWAVTWSNSFTNAS